MHFVPRIYVNEKCSIPPSSSLAYILYIFLLMFIIFFLFYNRNQIFTAFYHTYWLIAISCQYLNSLCTYTLISGHQLTLLIVLLHFDTNIFVLLIIIIFILINNRDSLIVLNPNNSLIPFK